MRKAETTDGKIIVIFPYTITENKESKKGEGRERKEINEKVQKR